MKDKEKQLISEIIQGNQRSFSLLCEAYVERLFHFSYSILNNREIAEEAVFDVFTSIWSRRDLLRDVDDITPYLYQAVRNQSLYYIRKQTLTTESTSNLYEIELIADDTTPEDQLLTKEYEGSIQEAINTLPPRCKEIFRLNLYDRLKNRDIAKLLKISEKTVSEQLLRARNHIKKIVRGQMNIETVLLFSILFL